MLVAGPKVRERMFVEALRAENVLERTREGRVPAATTANQRRRRMARICKRRGPLSRNDQNATAIPMPPLS
jgi:hypothetical protein